MTLCGIVLRANLNLSDSEGVVQTGPCTLDFGHAESHYDGAGNRWTSEAQEPAQEAPRTPERPRGARKVVRVRKRPATGHTDPFPEGLVVQRFHHRDQDSTTTGRAYDFTFNGGSVVTNSNLDPWHFNFVRKSGVKDEYMLGTLNAESPDRAVKTIAEWSRGYADLEFIQMGNDILDLLIRWAQSVEISRGEDFPIKPFLPENKHIFSQGYPPSGANAGDMWIDGDNNTHVWTGTEWVPTNGVVSAPNTSGQSLIEDIRKVMVKVNASGVQPTKIEVSPVQWEELLLQQAGSSAGAFQRLDLLDPAKQGSIFGLPIVVVDPKASEPGTPAADLAQHMDEWKKMFHHAIEGQILNGGPGPLTSGGEGITWNDASIDSLTPRDPGTEEFWRRGDIQRAFNRPLIVNKAEFLGGWTGA